MTIRRSPQLRTRIIVANRRAHKSLNYSEEVVKTMNESGDHHGLEHARWRDLNPAFQFMPSFAVVRNPWSRTASRYLFAKKIIEVEKKEPSAYADVSSFEAFLEERHIWGGKQYYWHRAIRGWFPQLDHVVDDNGKIMCDVLRLEHLDEELCAYFRIPGMSKRRNVTAMGEWKHLYTPKIIQTVADWYKDDIDKFGFDFDSTATKNTWKA